MNERITVETYVHASPQKVWDAFTQPEAVMAWNAASHDWHCPHAENDLREGGGFTYRMEAKDGSEGFDFSGTYTSVVPLEHIAYQMEDGRKVSIVFTQEGDGVRVEETFDPESENTLELQRSGWQAILDNFRNYTETQGAAMP